MIFDEIVAGITYQTTFQQIGQKGLVRWWTRTVELADFVESPMGQKRTLPHFQW